MSSQDFSLFIIISISTSWFLYSFLAWVFLKECHINFDDPIDLLWTFKFPVQNEILSGRFIILYMYKFKKISMEFIAIIFSIRPIRLYLESRFKSAHRFLVEIITLYFDLIMCVFTTYPWYIIDILGSFCPPFRILVPKLKIQLVILTYQHVL